MVAFERYLEAVQQDALKPDGYVNYGRLKRALAEGGAPAFDAALEAELGKVNGFAGEHVTGLAATVDALARESAAPEPVSALVARAGSAALRTSGASSRGLPSDEAELLQHAFQVTYHDLFVAKQAAGLNLAAVRKACKKRRKATGTGADARLADVRLEPFYVAGTQGVDRLVDAVEAAFARRFTGGDASKARARLRLLQRSPPPLRIVGVVGFMTGVVVALVGSVCWLALFRGSERPAACPLCPSFLLACLPALRVTLAPVIWAWAWCVSTSVWTRWNLNYVFLLDLDPRSELGPSRTLRVAATSTAVWLAVVVLLVGAVKTGFEPVSSLAHARPDRVVGLYPLFLILLFGFVCGAPPGVMYYRTRAYAARLVFKTVLRPFGSEVRFAENIVADVLTSSVKTLLDAESALRFYCSGDYRSAVPPETYTGRAASPIVTALPFWWRMHQCLRRWRDTQGTRERRLHLANCCKYLVAVAAICVASLGDYRHVFERDAAWTWGRALWFALLVLSTAYGYAWDVIVDWGTLRPRSDRVLPRWVFVVAAVLNLAGRLSWTLTVTPHSVLPGVHKEVGATVVMVVELCRRGLWLVLRVEHEYCTNAAGYRSVKEMPIILDESHFVHTQGLVFGGPTRATAAVLIANIALTATALTVVFFVFR